jgi:copper transport protein
VSFVVKWFEHVRTRLPGRSAWWCSVLACAAVAAVAVLGARPADAHAFLVATEPAQGERLAGAPAALVLEFSEAPDPASIELALETSNGDRVDLPFPEVSGTEARAPVDRLPDGVYAASWEATSAVDGHGSAGEFAFAVGEVDGVVPAARSTSSTSGWGWVASVSFFVGLALAGGALALRGLAEHDDGIPGVGIVRAGLLIAIAGAGVAVFEPSTTRDWASLAAIQVLALALLLVGLRLGWPAPLALVTVAAGAWAGRSHGAVDHGLLGWFVDFVHLAAGSVWAGSLVLVVAAGWRLRRQGRPWLGLVGRYARLALRLVVVLGLAGLVSALQLIPTWGDLWNTGYGRLIVAKAALFALALVGATAARSWWLPRKAVRGVRSVMTGEAALVAAAVVLAALLANAAPPLSAAASEELLGPPPLEGNVARDAGLAGQLNVSVISDGTRLDIDVFGPSGPVAGTEAEVTLEQPDGSSVDLVPRGCGPGCFTQALELADGTSIVRVSASAPDWEGGSYTTRLRWPPGPLARDQLAELVARMRRIPEITVIETTTSGPGSDATPGPITVSGDRFIESEPYAGGNIDDVRLVGEDRLALYVPGEQIFAVLQLDDAGRLSRARLVSPGHEIRREFAYPGGTP